MKQNVAETITKLNRALAQDFRLMPICALDSPVFLAIALPTSEGVTGLKPRLPAGRGLTLQQAMIAAGAEAVELRASLAQRHLSTLSAFPRRGGLAMAAALDLLTGEPVPIPAQEVYLDCAAILSEPLVFDANSTGCAAGATRNDATETALWECIERDAVALWWHGGLAAGPLSLDLIDRYQPRLMWWLDQRDRSTFLLDLTTDIGLPVVAAISAKPDGRDVALGTAARPLLADAALAAVTEMVQTEVSMKDARQMQDPELTDRDAQAPILTLPQLQLSDRTPPQASPQRVADLMQRLADLGHRVLAFDMTLPGDPLPSMRVLVPGLCAMGGHIDTGQHRRLCPGHPAPNFPEPF